MNSQEKNDLLEKLLIEIKKNSKKLGFDDIYVISGKKLNAIFNNKKEVKS